MKLSELAKKMILSILVISSICIIASAIYYRSLDFLPFVIGVFLGSAVSIAKVFLLERAVNNALKMEQKRAGNYVSLQHILRLLLSGAALLLGAIVPQISLWGVAAGVLAFQLSIYNIKFMSKNSN